jgi:hypothetical protein
MSSGKFTLPKPTVDPSNASGGEWTAENVRVFFCNPIYAGVGPYPAMVDDETWVQAAAKSLREDGAEQWLVNMLHCLRAAIPPTA